MFEGYTLAQQQQDQDQRGWNPKKCNALTYSTAEGVLFRRTSRTSSILDYEIVEAQRTTGIADCVGRWQGKWSGYVNPTDPSSRHAFLRIIDDAFGWTGFDQSCLKFRGLLGPELYRSTVALEDDSSLILTVEEDQAEKTPFHGTLFSLNVTGRELGAGGNYSKRTAGARFVALGDLIAERGDDAAYSYWSMVAICMASPQITDPDQLIWRLSPGIHRFPCH